MFRRAAKKDPFMDLVTPSAPVALLVTDAAGTIIYRNKWAEELRASVSAKRGDAVFKALSSEISRLARDSKTYPVTKMVEVEVAGGHAEAEVVVDRMGEWCVATWSDVTEREDGRRFLTKMHGELARATTSLSGVGTSLAGDTTQLSQRADIVASGSTEMTASISEIGRNAAQAATNTSAAVGAAEHVTLQVGALVESSAKIGSVSKLIASIAQQTNLLALNATIEAARAGEAGRGFAVVANEVKELANETSKATADIEPMIASIQSSSGAVSASMDEIVSLIGQIEAQQTTIASAVEEQSAASGEMSSSVSGIAMTIQSVSAAVDELHSLADQVSGQVDQIATRL
jgi:methyl-accepting chemotaxis protein